MKRALKIIGKTLFLIVGLLALYLIIGFCLSKMTVDEEANAKDEVKIYILTNGVHTDIVMPVKSKQIDWSKEITHENTIAADSNYQYIAMGWGDKGFYLETPTWADLKASVAFKAAFALSTTAMHCTYYSSMKESEDCKAIMISNEQYTRLVNYINDSFQKDANGHFMPIKTDAIYGKTDAFYEANGKYSMIRTCNSWANGALKYSGQRAAVWTAFDSGIFSKYELVTD